MILRRQYPLQGSVPGVLKSAHRLHKKIPFSLDLERVGGELADQQQHVQAWVLHHAAHPEPRGALREERALRGLAGVAVGRGRRPQQSRPQAGRAGGGAQASLQACLRSLFFIKIYFHLFITRDFMTWFVVSFLNLLPISLT